MSVTIPIHIEYTNGEGIPVNAFRVRLASDPSLGAAYGVKDEEGVVVVPDGTAVDNPHVGGYEYVLSVQQGKTYWISWEIVGESGDEPEYRTNRIGPVKDGSLTAVPDRQGSFVQNGYASLFLRLNDIDGQPVDAPLVTVTVSRVSDSEVLFTEAADRVGAGVYLFDWAVAGDTPAEDYLATWSYLFDGTTRTVVYKFSIIADASPGASYTLWQTAFRMRLEQLIFSLQSIPINYEEAKKSHDNREYSFAFQRWNQPAGVKVYRNKKQITGGYEIDYLNGKITFDRPNTRFDQVHATYNFRFFRDSDLDLFLLQGLNRFNTFVPQSQYILGQIPDRYVPGVLDGAIIEAYRTFMQALIWPKNRTLFETPEQADRAFEMYESLKKGVEEEWKILMEQKQYIPYAGRTAVIIQPMYVLPGGRSRFFRYLFGGGG